MATRSWLDKLRALVQKKRLVVLKFEESEWEALRASRRGMNEFTIARPHDLVEKLIVPVPCVVACRGEDEQGLYFGLVSSRGAITTLETRIKVKRVVQISPDSENELQALVIQQPHSRNLRTRLGTSAPIVTLPPALGSHVIERLASIDRNAGPMRAVAESLEGPKPGSNAALQEDAVRAALSAFGLGARDQAVSVDLVKGKDTALARLSIMEDSVIEHDARMIPGYELIGSDVTGRAVFQRDGERLEVFTANRRSLERSFGIDLLYLNITKQNVVMLQYKMLEPSEREAEETDWLYRPDAKLEEEIRRMSKFSKGHPPEADEYRLNASVFYLKFVKRDAHARNAAILLPLEHFEKLREDPRCKGPKGGLRISYRSLGGRYLRQGPFLDLVRAGYIGASAKTTRAIRVLIDSVLKNNRALVAAIHHPPAKT